MTTPVERELEILWSDDEDHGVEEKIEALGRLKSEANLDDLPVLIAALKSDKSDFWIRELLAEPIGQIGGADYLSELFDAFEQNYADGHDNDSFAHHLTEIAYFQPKKCKTKLEELIENPHFAHRDHAEWLLKFCDSE